jgi:aminoglycoside 3-N-acetyltransferase
VAILQAAQQKTSSKKCSGFFEGRERMNTIKTSVVIKRDIKEGLKKLGLPKGAVVLVHSSLSKFGYVEGKADTVIDALLETVGREGTIVVPTITVSPRFSADIPPIFDPDNTPCWTGVIPETLRNRKEAIRSLHPTHSVAAIGAKAKEIIEGHEKCMSPCGKGTPYEKIRKLDNGFLLFLGANLASCTMLHHIEEIAGLPYVLQKDLVDAYVVIKGREKRVRTSLHTYKNTAGRKFTKLEPLLIGKGIMQITIIGEAITRLVKAKELTKLTLSILNRNPWFLLNPDFHYLINGE